MSDVVQIERVGSTGLIALDNPPVNAASTALRQGLLDAVQVLDDDTNIDVIAIYAKGHTFIAGADIREFGRPLQEPLLPDLCTTIERTKTPVISILHGTTLGGGLEVALGTHARIGIKGLKVGLPEVALGLLPGAGGTQRTPRLTGINVALDMITSGRHIPAEEALEAGLVDRIEEGDPRDIALKSAQAVRSGDLATRRTGDIDVVPDDETIENWKTKIKGKFPHLLSPQKCVEAVSHSVLPIDEGISLERALFKECMASSQSAGLCHAFFSERAVQKVPEASATARTIEAIGVIGGGTMGSGIGTSALMADVPVTLVEQNEEALGRTRDTISGNLEGAVKRGKMTAEKRANILDNLLTLTTEFSDLKNADLIIEAVFEEMPVKKEIFTKLDAVAKPGAILASNTSYLDINEIAACTSRPSDILGLHFFSPAHIMRLLEVVVADKTAPEVAATGFALAKRMRKVAVRAGVCDGFIGNRILSHYLKVTDYMVMDGASPYQIDDALEAFGFAMGTFAVADLAGLDIGWAARKRRAATRSAQERDIEIPDRICEQGWFGRKTGRGYYIYDGRQRSPNPDVSGIIDKEREKANITPRPFTDEEIINRYMTAMILESARVVEDGIALRPIDVDAVYLFGYGFPRFRGGPLHFADLIGAEEIVRHTEQYAREDDFYWQVPEILHKMAKDGSKFADLNGLR